MSAFTAQGATRLSEGTCIQGAIRSVVSITVTAADAAAIADSPSVRVSTGDVIANTAASSDAATVLISLGKPTTNTAALADAATVKISLGKPITNGASVAEALSAKISLGIAAADSAAAAGAATQLTGLLRAVAQTTQSVDTANAAHSSAAAVNDTATTTDGGFGSRFTSQGALPTAQGACMQGAALVTVGGVIRTLKLQRIISSAAAAGDVGAPLISLVRFAGAPVLPGPTLYPGPALYPGAGDLVALSDSAVFGVTIGRAVANTSAAADALHRTATVHVAISEAAALTDSPARLEHLLRTLTEAAAANDSLATTRALARAATDPSATVDTVSGTWTSGSVRVISDIGLTLDLLSQVLVVSRAAADQAAISDTVLEESAYSIAAVDASATTDLTQSLSNYVRQIVDELDGVDGATPTVTILITAADSLLEGDEITLAALIIGRLVADEAVAVETLIGARYLAVSAADLSAAADTLVDNAVVYPWVFLAPTVGWDQTAPRIGRIEQMYGGLIKIT
jgi:hypothetical protein